MNTIYKEVVMKKLKEGGSLVETCFFGEPIFFESIVALLSLSLHFSLSDLLSKKKNRNKLRVTWMNSLSLFARKKIGRRLGITQRDASNLFHRQEQHEGC